MGEVLTVDLLRVMSALLIAGISLLAVAALLGRFLRLLDWAGFRRFWTRASPFKIALVVLLPLLLIVAAAGVITSFERTRLWFVDLFLFELALVWAALVGLALLLVVVGTPALAVRLSLPRIWAVARQTLAEAIRMKIAVFFIVLMLLGFWGATRTQGDGSVSGRVQSFLVYSLTSLGVLLSLLSIFLSRSLSEELVHRQVLMLMAKPLPRWQYLLGKWLGVVLLDAVLLTLAGAGIHLTVTRYLARQPPLNEYDAGRLRNEVLTARYAAPFEVPRDEFKQEVDRLYAWNLEEGIYDQRAELDPQAEKELLRKYVDARWRNVPLGDTRVFEFKNILCERRADLWLQVRYKAQANAYPPDEILRTRWLAGNPEKGTRLYLEDRQDVFERYHTIPFPTDAVAEDRTLTITFQNWNHGSTDQFPNIHAFEGDRGLEVLFKVGTFGGNLVRLLALMQCKLMFLTAVALLFATVFSFPVACLCSLTVYVLATMRGFLDDAIGFLSSEGASGLYKAVFPWLLKGLYLLIPDFASYSATEMVADGRNVTLMWVLEATLFLVVIGTTLAALLACVLFHRREVSEVSV